MNFTRIPLHIQARMRDELSKSLPDTDPVTTIAENPSPYAFNVPVGRNVSNVVFRRRLDGTIDIEEAKHIVINVLQMVRDKSPLTTMEKLILSVCFPVVFSFMEPAIAAQLSLVHFRITPEERVAVCQAVAGFLREQMNWNAGRGGGSVLGRTESVR